MFGGRESSTRALPLRRKGDVYFNNDIESGSTEHKMVRQSHGVILQKK